MATVARGPHFVKARETGTSGRSANCARTARHAVDSRVAAIRGGVRDVPNVSSLRFSCEGRGRVKVAALGIVGYSNLDCCCPYTSCFLSHGEVSRSTLSFSGLVHKGLCSGGRRRPKKKKTKSRSSDRGGLPGGANNNFVRQVGRLIDTSCSHVVGQDGLCQGWKGCGAFSISEESKAALAKVMKVLYSLSGNAGTFLQGRGLGGLTRGMRCGRRSSYRSLGGSTINRGPVPVWLVNAQRRREAAGHGGVSPRTEIGGGEQGEDRSWRGEGRSWRSGTCAAFSGGMLYRPPRIVAVPRAMALAEWVQTSGLWHDPLLRDSLVAVGAGVGATMVIRFFDTLVLKGVIEQKLSRKLVHISSGLLLMTIWPLFSSSPSARYLAAIVPLINALRLLVLGTGLIKYEAGVKAISRAGNPSELLKGPLYYVMVIGFVTIFLWRDSPTGPVALALMCSGDGIADIVGRRLGSAKLPYNDSKSWAGSIAMFTCGLSAALSYAFFFSWHGYYKCDPMDASFKIILISLAATIVESLPLTKTVDDNIAVPATAVLLGSVFFPSWSIWLH